MSEYQTPIAGVLLLVSALVIVALRIREPGQSSPRAQRTQLGALERLIAGVDDRALRVDWMRYKAVPKPALVEVANKYGWHLLGDDTAGRSWLLHFNRDPHASVTHARENEPHQRLAVELAAATPDAAGRYTLDRTRYVNVPLADLTSAATATNWQVVDTGLDTVVLARPGTTTASFQHGPFLDGASPETLRTSPAVAERAREIQRTRGFDPLSAPNLNRARERHTFWGKQFGRQVRLAFFYGFVGLLMLGITFGGSVPDGNPSWITLAITLIVVALFAVAVVKARRIRKLRSAEIGDFLTAYEELNTLYQRERSAHCDGL